MTESSQEAQEAQEAQETAQSQKAVEIRRFVEVLRAMAGKVITVVNPESYEDAPMGSRLTTGFYKAKLVAVGDDFITLATEFQHKKGEKAKEPVRQFVPLDRIKRISVMRSDRIIHL